MPVLVFRITLKSNYHLGAGYGKGFGIDSALFREDDGRPAIRGTTLCGLLRDGARRLLALPALKGYLGREEEILARLFGGPAEVKPWRIGSAYPPEDQGRDFQVVRRARIDPVIRRAEEQKLFSQEEGLAGEIFVFRVECPENTDARLDEAAFLVAAARNVRRLGRSRRRGLGECAIHLTGVEEIDASQKPAGEEWEAWFLRRFQENWLRGTPTSPAAARPEIPAVIASSPAGGEPVRLLVVARLDEPALVAGQSPAGNQYETRRYIPGSTLLGALAARAVQRGALDHPAGYRDFVSLFRRGAALFPVLYPARYHNGRLYPAVPAPRGLLTCSIKPFREAQDDGHGIYPAIGPNGEEGARKCPGKNCPGKMEPLDGFLVLYADMRLHEPPERVEIHIRVDEKTDRVRRGDLFGYSLLSAGQYFLGEMICADRGIWEKLKNLCGLEEGKPLPLVLGKGRQRGYGRTRLLFIPHEGPSPWIQRPLADRVPERPEVVALTLLTDTVVVDPWGRQATGFDPEWLEKEIGLGPVEICAAYARTGVVDGFNTTLGLPRWRDLAIAAGSVAWLRFKDFPTDGQKRMQELEDKGIGLRRNEGFGRIAFNHPLYDAWQELTTGAVELPEDMWSERSPIPKCYKRRWQRKLEEEFAGFTLDDDRFLALARWLYLNSALPPQELAKKLPSFGTPDEGLKNFVGGEKEFEIRDKASFFKKGEEKIKKIIGLLKMLQENFSPDYHQTAVQLLAERIAGAAIMRRKEE